MSLPRIRRALGALDKLAAEHPAALEGKSAEQWEAILRRDEEDMAKTNKPKTQTEQFVIRLSGDLAGRVDAYGEELRRTHPGPAWNRSDVVRFLLAKALDAVDLSKQLEGGPRRKK